MARWRALPDELDPRAAELVVHMRRCVDRAGLTLSALAERTGYSHTSWERFLDARLLAPRRAIDALAEATDTSPVHLTTLWELAEQAWNRAESTSGDPATNQLRVPPAVLPVREVGGPTEGNSWGLAGYKGPSRAGGSAAAAAAEWVAPAGGGSGSQEAAPTGAAPTSTASMGAGSRDGEPGRARRWGRWERWARGGGDSRTEQGLSERTPRTPRPPRIAERPSRPPRRWLTFVLATLTALPLATTAFLLTDSGPPRTVTATNSPSSSPHLAPLPPGVKCTGTACVGKDAEAMGCGGDRVTTAESATVAGRRVEVRYSRVCGAAWGRVLGAAPGDVVQVLAGKARQHGDVTVAGDTISYTPMVAVRTPTEARACVLLASGRQGCTT